MKYIVRAFKYLIYFVIIFFIIVGILVLLMHPKDASLSAMFKPGSLWQIAAIFACVSAIYPKLGFIRRSVNLEGDISRWRDVIDETMSTTGYKLYKEEEGRLYFRQTRAVARLSRMFEDEVTISNTATGFELEGLRKDILRLASAIEYKGRMK